MRTFALLLTLLASVAISTPTLALNVGDQAPNFQLPMLTTKGNLTLDQFRGKVVYVDFWASWCGPCRESLPLLSQMRREMKGQPFEILAINLDEEVKEGRLFLKKYPVSYPTLHDAAGKTPEVYGLKGMPTSYLIDKNGVVQAIHQGFKPSHMEKIRSEVTALLKQ